jgi:GntR family histidine utilization transcriptional repressor
MKAALSRSSEIRREIEDRIRSGAWAPGHRVPSEHELMEHYGCSRMTVNKALSALAEAGLIARRRRAGTFVSAPATEETVLEIHDMEAEIAASGRRYAYSLLGRAVRRANAEDRRRLPVPAGTRVLHLRACHTADGSPHALEDRLISLAAVPQAEAERFDEVPGGTWLLKQVPWTDAEHSIRAVSAGARLASQLGISKGAACLVIERRTWQSGAPVTQVRLIYPGDRHRLVGRFRPASALRPPGSGP